MKQNLKKVNLEITTPPDSLRSWFTLSLPSPIEGEENKEGRYQWEFAMTNDRIN
jgi:hypothetical protein